jgi:hypothetical protein
MTRFHSGIRGYVYENVVKGFIPKTDRYLIEIPNIFDRFRHENSVY